MSDFTSFENRDNPEGNPRKLICRKPASPKTNFKVAGGQRMEDAPGRRLPWANSVQPERKFLSRSRRPDSRTPHAVGRYEIADFCPAVVLRFAFKPDGRSAIAQVEDRGGTTDGDVRGSKVVNRLFQDRNCFLRLGKPAQTNERIA